MPSERFELSGHDGTSADIYILGVKGPITSATSSAFQDAVKGVNARCVIIDLAGVPSVDSMAVGALVRAFVSCNKAGRKMALVGLSHRVQNVLELTGIAPLFETYTSVAEAEQAMRQSA